MKSKANPLPYFDTRAGTYWLEVGSGNFLSLDASQLKLHLRESGLSKESFVGSLNELERAMFLAQVERAIDYAGPIAGHKAGYHKSLDGKSVLVTRSSTSGCTSPKQKCDVVQSFLDSLLGSQRPYLYAWLHVARKAMASGVFVPGQMIVFAGESGCGKSLCQALITAVLGGRSAKPYRYMIGETPFNSELAAAEHLMIEDENSSSDIRSRRKFGASVKDFTVNASMSVHAKGREAVTLSPFRRLTDATGPHHTFRAAVSMPIICSPPAATPLLPPIRPAVSRPLQAGLNDDFPRPKTMPTVGEPEVVLAG